MDFLAESDGPGVPMAARERLCVLALAVALGSPGPAAGAEASAGEQGASAICLEESGWWVPGTRAAQRSDSRRVLGLVVRRDVVLLGEEHDDADHHRWQLQVLAGLHALRPKLVIGFEMFPRRVQPVLDRWVAGELSVTEFLAQTEWDEVWAHPAELYLPLFEFARMNRIPMLALNVDRQLIRKVAASGWAAVPADQREGVGNPAPAPAAYREFLSDVHRQHASLRGGSADGPGPDPAFDRFVESQLVWDRAMAEILARGKAAGGRGPLVVGIVGSGHLRFGHGVAHQLRALGIASTATLLPLPVAGAECTGLPAQLADALFAIPAAREPSAPPRLGIALESRGGQVLISSVGAGSLAESSDLRSGDRIVAVAGRPATDVSMVQGAVRRQPPGTVLPVQIERGEVRREILVRFPVD